MRLYRYGRFGCWYLKKCSGTREFRGLISRAISIDAVEKRILHIPIGEMIDEPEIEKAADCCA